MCSSSRDPMYFNESRERRTLEVEEAKTEAVEVSSIPRSRVCMIGRRAFLRTPEVTQTWLHPPLNIIRKTPGAKDWRSGAENGLCSRQRYARLQTGGLAQQRLWDLLLNDPKFNMSRTQIAPLRDLGSQSLIWHRGRSTVLYLFQNRCS